MYFYSFFSEVKLGRRTFSKKIEKLKNFLTEADFPKM